LGERLPLFPLHTLLLPQTDLGLHVFERRYRELVADCLSEGREFGVALIRRSGETRVRTPGFDEPYAVGTAARISGHARLPDGRYLLEVEGTRRFTIESSTVNGSYPSAVVSWLPEPIGNFARARAASREVERLVSAYRALCGDGEVVLPLPVDPVARSYEVASLLRVPPYKKQRLLELASASERLEAEAAILRREVALLEHLRARRG
jgi:Lon protease-like protein